MSQFSLSKASVAIAVAMVGTIRTGDDALRFATRASAEGFGSISDLIAHDSVKQAKALQRELGLPVMCDAAAGDVIYSKTTLVGDVCTTESTTYLSGNQAPETTAEQAFGAGNFAESATELGSIWDTASIAAEPATNDNPLPFVPLATDPAATTSTSTTLATVSNADLDSAGLPWDARIHSSSRAKLAKGGGWKLKRGLDPQLVEQVEAELRAVMSIPAPTAPTETQGLHPSPNPLSVAAVNAITAAMPKNGPVPPTQPAAATAGITTFAQLMPAITAAKLDLASVNSVLQQFGIPSMPLLATRQDLIPQIAGALGLA